MEHILRLLARQRLHRGDRQPALVPGDDRGPLRRRLGASASTSPTAARSSCSGPRAGSATRPGSSATRSWSSPATRSPTSTSARCASSTSPTTGSRPWRPSGSPTPSQFGVAITGEDGRIQGFQEKPDPAEALSDLANCGIYMFRSEIFDYFPEPGTSKAASDGRPTRLRRLGDGRLPGPARRATSPSTRTRSTRYWNDIGNLEELRQGNLDALLGEVAIEPGAPEVGDGVWSAGPLEGAAVSGPALLGAGVELGEGCPDRGPGGHRRRLPDRRRGPGPRRDPARGRRGPGRGHAGRRHRGPRRRGLTLI